MLQVPQWLAKDHAGDRAVIELLTSHQPNVVDYRSRTVELSDFLPSNSKGEIQLTNFVAKRDTLFFTYLVRCAMRIKPQSRLLIDLCTGSAIPMISAALYSQSSLPFFGIDVDPSAIELASVNIESCGLQERISVRRADLRELLESKEVTESEQIILVANPPYLPCPPGVMNHEYLPVNGGSDGTRFIESVLTAKLPIGTIVAIQWGSVTNPARVMSWIKEFFEVEAVQVWELPLGRYSLSSEIYPHLNQLREQGISSYFGVLGSDQSQLVMGAVLRKVR